MNTKNLMKYLTAVAIVGILFASCKKKTQDETDKDTTASSDNALAEGTYNDVHNIADQASAGTLSSYLAPSTSNEKGLLSACATVVIDTAVNPHTITVNFGATNCLCNDGRYRRGIVNVSYSGHYRDSASTHTISFTNYFVNDNQVMGTKTVTNNGHNSSHHLTFSIQVNGTIIKANNGGTITWTSTRTREWVAGESTPWNWTDDEYLITGTATGTNALGNSFTAATTSALDIKMNCHYIVAGGFQITPSGKATRYVDYGNGTCDDQATVTINGTVYNITLH